MSLVDFDKIWDSMGSASLNEKVLFCQRVVDDEFGEMEIWYTRGVDSAPFRTDDRTIFASEISEMSRTLADFYKARGNMPCYMKYVQKELNYRRVGKPLRAALAFP